MKKYFKYIFLFILLLMILNSCGELYCQVYAPPRSKYCSRRVKSEWEKWEKENPPVKQK